MGMYDRVVIDVKCDKCGEKLDEVQSKSGLCVLDSLTVKQLLEQAAQESGESEVTFYGHCDNCGSFNQFNAIDEGIIITRASGERIPYDARY